MVKIVDTIEKKLRVRPEMRYLFDWCLEWMQSERAEGRIPTFTGMEDEWNHRWAAGEPFFQKYGVRYAKNNLAIRWHYLLEYEQRKTGASFTEEGGLDSFDGSHEDIEPGRP